MKTYKIHKQNNLGFRVQDFLLSAPNVPSPGLFCMADGMSHIWGTLINCGNISGKIISYRFLFFKNIVNIISVFMGVLAQTITSTAVRMPEFGGTTNVGQRFCSTRLLSVPLPGLCNRYPQFV